MADLLSPDLERELKRWRRWLVIALLLLCAAGLRHHLVWGGGERAPWLAQVLNAFEGLCLCAFAGLGGVAWLRAMALLQGQDVALKRLITFSLPILVAAVLVPCFLTADPIDYVMRGRILALHDGNPYRDVAIDYPSDPFVEFGDRRWKHMPLPYGPLVANLQGVIAWLANLLPVGPRVELITALVLFKLVFAGALVACAVVAARIAAHMHAGRGAWAFVAVLWNPLLLNDCLANAHNDSLVLLCVLLAILAAMSSRFGGMVVALCLGVMTKVVPAVLGPIWLVTAWRRGKLPQVAIALLICAAIVGAFYLQFFVEVGYAATLEQQNNLEGASLWWAVHQVTGISLSTLSTIGRVAVVAWVANSCLRLWHRSNTDEFSRELLFATASSLLLLAVLGAALFGTWYHVWWLPFGLLLGRGYLYRAAVCASLTSSLAYLFFASMRTFDEPAQWWTVTTGVFVPLLLALRLPRSEPHARA